MRLGIMQPYFFPYIGYFDVIGKTDQWIVFDVVKYQPKHWMNRNRILEPNKGEQYITVPVDKASGSLLTEVRTKDADAARDKILRQLSLYRSVAPFFDDVYALVDETFARFDGGLLRDLNVIGLQLVCARLEIPFNYSLCSSHDFDFSNVSHAGQWALEICDQCGATGYVNPPGGRPIFKIEEWRERQIDIAFTSMPDFRYDVRNRWQFVPNLSILDCMMWSSPDRIRSYLAGLSLDHP
ncbi:hypothetical protein GGD81_003317 [Rhodobium orientis]|uniref:Glycine transferase n=1 Tax=Rhodobium orientis TaxID=34017 RepID=A0A327K082_9HYPH|nr:WbqC family protein [Rhodobium orientis]MBB4304259.1 hypothetical protein [Rhodobium orientis]MBK5948245.1 hypothetical protein [Rhodobium orientis]RAI28768.1 hypothetical protein CH339_05020 [Rhodobium orientis]